MRIVKADFTDALVDFSQNTPDERVNPHINDALSFDVMQALPYGLVAVLLSAPIVLVAPHVPGTAYALGVYVSTESLDEGVFRKKVWKALAATDTTPDPENLAWEYSDLLSFWEGFVKPYWVVAAYLRYIGVGNVFSTPSGMRSFNETWSNNIDASTFGAFRRAFQTKHDDYKARMLNELSRRSNTVADVIYKKQDTCYTEPSSPLGFNVL